MDEDFLEFINYVEDDPYLPVPRNFIRDQRNPLEWYTDGELVQRFRFTRMVILHVLLPIVFPANDLDNRGLPIPPIIKLCVALRFFATGSYQRVCGDITDISQSSVSRIVAEISDKLARKCRQFVKFPQNRDELRSLKTKFYNIANFPGVIGCIDGTHIEIKSPGGLNAEVYRNRKGWMSLNIQVVAGPQLQIQDIVIRWPGSAHDSRMFNSSSIKMKLERGDLAGIILGDSAYSQTQYVYTPLLQTNTRAEQRYNGALIRTRNVVERTFGVWKGRFCCLVGGLQLQLRNTVRVIAATAVLHNIAIQHRQQFFEQDFVQERHIPQPVAQNGVRGNAIRHAFIQRHFV